MSFTYKTIKYFYFNSQEPNLIVIFPQAMQTSNDSKTLINLLNRVGNVIFIESGYYGITRIDTSNQTNWYSMSAFRENLYKLLGNFKYKKLYLVAGSVGAIHALSFARAYPNKTSKIILAGPALYKKKGIIDVFYKFLLDFAIILEPDLFFKLGVEILKTKTPWFIKTYHNVSRSSGALSYLLCLKEVMIFTSKNQIDLENLISRKVDVFLGKNDNAFKLMCDEGLCLKAKSCEWIESDHSTLNGAKQHIYRLLSSFSN